MKSQKELLDWVIPQMKKKGVAYKKFKPVFARKASEGEAIATITNDGVETTNQAGKGDYIVKNQTDAEEKYILTKKKFKDRYVYAKRSKNGFSEYLPKGKIVGLELTPAILKELDLPSHFHFEASWGEPMIAKENDFLVCPPDFSEVYRIARKEFFETYEIDS
ncbi:MAG: hypothetical protein R2825_31395 [Saprospiraceae bacterium]